MVEVMGINLCLSYRKVNVLLSPTQNLQMFYLHFWSKTRAVRPPESGRNGQNQVKDGSQVKASPFSLSPAIQCVSDVINFENSLNLNLFSINFFLIPSTYIFLYNYFLKNKFSYIKIGDK